MQKNTTSPSVKVTEGRYQTIRILEVVYEPSEAYMVVLRPNEPLDQADRAALQNALASIIQNAFTTEFAVLVLDKENEVRLIRKRQEPQEGDDEDIERSGKSEQEAV